MTDGQQAIDAVIAQPVPYFSMIILDINMPGKNGIQACHEIIEHFNSTGEFGVAAQRRSKLSMPQFFSSNHRKGKNRKSMSNEKSDSLSKYSGLVKKNIETVVKELAPKIFALTSDIDD